MVDHRRPSQPIHDNLLFTQPQYLKESSVFTKSFKGNKNRRLIAPNSSKSFQTVKTASKNLGKNST